MMARLLTPLAIKIGGGIIAALLVAIGILVWRADSLSDARDEALRDNGALQTSLAASNASLVALEADLSAMVEEGRLTRARATEALREAEIAGNAMRDEAAAGEATGRIDWRGSEL